MSSRSLKCKDDWRAVAKISMPETKLANFRQIKKKVVSRVFWEVYVLRFRPPHHYESAAVSLISICVQTLQPVFTSKREKKLSSATMFFFGFFFSLTGAGDDMSMHVTVGRFWETGASTWHQNVLLNICCFVPDGEMSRKWPLFYFFFLKEKPFESLATADLFSLLPSFAPFFHSCFPYSSPHFRLISAVNIQEARCSDQGARGRRKMKGISETNYSASLTQNVPPAFLYCLDQYYHGDGWFP